MYFTKPGFWSDLSERAISTAAQAALGVVSAGAFGFLEIASWQAVGVAAGAAAVVAVLKAFSTGRTGTPEEPAGDEYGDNASEDHDFSDED